MYERLIAVFICLLIGCATTQTTPEKTTCFKAKVIVTADDGSGHMIAPGVPVDVIVRAKDGSVLQSVKTDANGNGSFEVCWDANNAPAQVEAKLSFLPQFVGTFASFYNYTDTYCLALPQKIGGHCGVWGTGPSPL